MVSRITPVLPSQGFSSLCVDTHQQEDLRLRVALASVTVETSSTVAGATQAHLLALDIDLHSQGHPGPPPVILLPATVEGLSHLQVSKASSPDGFPSGTLQQHSCPNNHSPLGKMSV